MADEASLGAALPSGAGEVLSITPPATVVPGLECECTTYRNGATAAGGSYCLHVENGARICLPIGASDAQSPDGWCDAVHTMCGLAALPPSPARPCACTSFRNGAQEGHSAYCISASPGGDPTLCYPGDRGCNADHTACDASGGDSVSTAAFSGSHLFLQPRKRFPLARSAPTNYQTNYQAYVSSWEYAHHPALAAATPGSVSPVAHDDTAASASAAMYAATMALTSTASAEPPPPPQRPVRPPVPSVTALATAVATAAVAQSASPEQALSYLARDETRTYLQAEGVSIEVIAAAIHTIEQQIASERPSPLPASSPPPSASPLPSPSLLATSASDPSPGTLYYTSPDDAQAGTEAPAGSRLYAVTATMTSRPRAAGGFFLGGALLLVLAALQQRRVSPGAPTSPTAASKVHAAILAPSAVAAKVRKLSPLKKIRPKTAAAAKDSPAKFAALAQTEEEANEPNEAAAEMGLPDEAMLAASAYSRWAEPPEVEDELPEEWAELLGVHSLPPSAEAPPMAALEAENERLKQMLEVARQEAEMEEARRLAHENEALKAQLAREAAKAEAARVEEAAKAAAARRSAQAARQKAEAEAARRLSQENEALKARLASQVAQVQAAKAEAARVEAAKAAAARRSAEAARQKAEQVEAARRLAQENAHLKAQLAGQAARAQTAKTKAAVAQRSAEAARQEQAAKQTKAKAKANKGVWTSNGGMELRKAGSNWI